MLRLTTLLRLASPQVFRTTQGATLHSDPTLVSLPDGTSGCHVFRNVVSEYDEQLISEELSRIMAKEGQSHYADPSKVDQKVVRNVYLELYGDRDFTELKNWKKKETQRVPGLVWSPTVLRLTEQVGNAILGVDKVDSARVVEHQLPGYEMHVEQPTVGKSFLYLNLLSDAVLTMDDEATGRCGQVYLPQRSMMLMSGEARWGWRFGEHPVRRQVFVGPTGLKKVVTPDVRLSIQLWKFDVGMVDRRKLQDELELALKEAEKQAQGVKRQEEREKQLKAEKGEGPAMEGESVEGSESLFSLPPRLKEQLMGKDPKSSDAFTKPNQTGQGSLGGDMKVDNRTKTGVKKTMADLDTDMKRYRRSFDSVQSTLKELKTMNDTNQPLTDDWIQQKMRTQSATADLDADYGFDPSDTEKAWDEADRTARFYKQRLKSMNYDGDQQREAKPIDVGFDPDVMAPLDVKHTVEKLVPHMKDGQGLQQQMNSMRR